MILEGIKHITDFSGIDHLLFLIALVAPYSPRDWKKCLLLVTVFTVGHSLSLILSAHSILRIDSALIETLIPVTILITALYNLLFRKSHTSRNLSLEILVTLIFGLIHGCGFSSYFKMIVHNNQETQDLILFNLGIEFGQVLILLAVLILGIVIQRIPSITSKIWMRFLSLIAVVLSLQMIIEKWFS